MNEVFGENISQKTTSTVIDTKKFLEKELDFWYKKYKNGEIDSDKFDDIHDEIGDIVDDYETDLNKLQEKYQILKQDLLKETGLELQKEGKINEARNNIYDYFGINQITYKNSTFDRLYKGIIDGVFENAELIDALIESRGMILIEGLKNLLTIEGITQIFKSIGESISDIFFGDAYEKGLKIGEILPTIISGGIGYGIKKIGSSLLKNTLKLKNKKLFEEKIISQVNNSGKKQIDLSELNSQNKAIVNEMITNNFPLVEITRITSNQNLINFSINGVKNLNDTFGQAFCDKIIFELKSQLREKFENSRINKGFSNRVLKDDYKNITFLNNSGNILNDIFGNIKDKSEIINSVILSLNKEIHTLARELVYEELKSKNLVYASKNEFEKIVGKKSKEIKEQISQNLSFGIGSVKVGENLSDIDKLNLIRQVEISSKLNGNSNKLSIKEYSHDEIISQIQNSNQILKEIVDNFGGNQFEFNGVKYDVLNGNNISAELLRYVKKFPGEVKPQNLVKLVEQYYLNLNSSLDFISPVKGSHLQAFEEARKINEQIRSGLVDVKYFKESFKGGLTREYFLESIKNSSGKAIFVDIKDMGIDNIYDFQKRADKILKLLQQTQANLISKELADAQINQIMLEAGKDVTDKFIEIYSKITSSYPNSKISFGGDEFYIFIPEKKSGDGVISQIKSIVDNNTQTSRVLYRETTKGTDKKEVFEFLDKFSKTNKVLEIELEKIFKQQNIPQKLNSNSLSFGENILSQISREGFNFDEFINKFGDFLKSNSNRIINGENMFSNNIFEGIKIKIFQNDGTFKIFLQ